MTYRKFWIENSKEERWDLTEKDLLTFLNNPQGLGLTKTIEITRYGEKGVKSSETYAFPSVSGDILFYNSRNVDRYHMYNLFCRFIVNTPLILHYQIPNDEYTLECEVTKLAKTESKPERIMTCAVTFSGLGFWQGHSITITGTEPTYSLANDGDFPCGFEIEINGNLTNPYILLQQDGELYGEAKFDSETAFNSLYINSNDGEQNVILKQNDSILPNPLSHQDLSISNGSIYVTFIKLARGISELTIGAESGSPTSVKVNYRPLYRSV